MILSQYSLLNPPVGGHGILLTSFDLHWNFDVHPKPKNRLFNLYSIEGNNQAMSENNQYTLKQAINRMIETYQLRGKLTENKLIESWEQHMGKMVAKHTQKLKLDGNTLYITLDSSVLRQELSYAKEKIQEHLNKEIGRPVIQEIVLR